MTFPIAWTTHKKIESEIFSYLVAWGFWNSNLRYVLIDFYWEQRFAGIHRQIISLMLCSSGNLIIYIGQLCKAGLGNARHRALLFKTLADACRISCQLMRGSHLSKVSISFHFEDIHVALAMEPAQTWKDKLLKRNNRKTPFVLDHFAVPSPPLLSSPLLSSPLLSSVFPSSCYLPTAYSQYVKTSCLKEFGA